LNSAARGRIRTDDLPIMRRFTVVCGVLACAIVAGQVRGRVQLIPSCRAE
jgi:hypothetical protein